MPFPKSSLTPGTFTGALLAPLTIAAFGIVFFVLAQTQPAWIGTGTARRIGPGLFAQWLSLGIVGLSLIWAAVELAVLRRDRPAAPTTEADGVSRHLRPDSGVAPGLALLTAVCLFALLLPVAGLVAACAAAAAIAGWGAGDRGPRALGLSALLGMAVAASIGLTLLPPTARLWPWSLL